MVWSADLRQNRLGGRAAPKAVVAVTAAGFGNFELIVVVFLFQTVQSVVEHSEARPIKARVHTSNRSDSGARPTTTRLGLGIGAYLSADEALKLTGPCITFNL
jgi:hypothetical protein